MQHKNTEEEAPFIESGRKPEFKDLGPVLVEFFECATCGFVCMILVAYATCFVILGMNANEAVFQECGMYWSYILASLVAPLGMPLLYCLCICNVSTWEAFVFSYTSVFALVGFVLNFNASKACVESMRQSTSPVPWLYFLGWTKCILYLSCSVATLFKALKVHNP